MKDMDFGKERRILFSREEISKRVSELGNEISRDYGDKEIVVISLLKGSFILQQI